MGPEQNDDSGPWLCLEHSAEMFLVRATCKMVVKRFLETRGSYPSAPLFTAVFVRCLAAERTRVWNPRAQDMHSVWREGDGGASYDQWCVGVCAVRRRWWGEGSHARSASGSSPPWIRPSGCNTQGSKVRYEVIRAIMLEDSLHLLHGL